VKRAVDVGVVPRVALINDPAVLAVYRYSQTIRFQVFGRHDHAVYANIQQHEAIVCRLYR
jgi:hypothetical protein